MYPELSRYPGLQNARLDLFVERYLGNLVGNITLDPVKTAFNQTALTCGDDGIRLNQRPFLLERVILTLT